MHAHAYVLVFREGHRGGRQRGGLWRGIEGGGRGEGFVSLAARRKAVCKSR